MLVLAVNPPLVPDQQPAVYPACRICVRAWQCRQQHSQYTPLSILFEKATRSQQRSFAQLLIPAISPSNQKKPLGWWRLVSLLFPPATFYVQPLGCSRYLITPQLVGFVSLSLCLSVSTCSPISFATPPCTRLWPFLLLLMHALCI